jgi:hypothetical protein
MGSARSRYSGEDDRARVERVVHRTEATGEVQIHFFVGEVGHDDEPPGVGIAGEHRRVGAGPDGPLHCAGPVVENERGVRVGGPQRQLVVRPGGMQGPGGTDARDGDVEVEVWRRTRHLDARKEELSVGIGVLRGVGLFCEDNRPSLEGRVHAEVHLLDLTLEADVALARLFPVGGFVPASVRRCLQ